MLNKRISESDLVLPSLYLLAKHPAGALSTSELIVLLTQLMQPSGKDAEILAGRIDEALKNLLPVSPNSHRVIHKNRITASEIDIFKTYIHKK